MVTTKQKPRYPDEESSNEDEKEWLKATPPSSLTRMVVTPTPAKLQPTIPLKPQPSTVVPFVLPEMPVLTQPKPMGRINQELNLGQILPSPEYPENLWQSFNEGAWETSWNEGGVRIIKNGREWTAIVKDKFATFKTKGEMEHFLKRECYRRLTGNYNHVTLAHVYGPYFE